MVLARGPLAKPALSIVQDKLNDLAAFDKASERNILDHGPQVLGLRKIDER